MFTVIIPAASVPTYYFCIFILTSQIIKHYSEALLSPHTPSLRD